MPIIDCLKNQNLQMRFDDFDIIIFPHDNLCVDLKDKFCEIGSVDFTITISSPSFSGKIVDGKIVER